MTLFSVSMYLKNVPTSFRVCFEYFPCKHKFEAYKIITKEQSDKHAETEIQRLQWLRPSTEKNIVFGFKALPLLHWAVVPADLLHPGWSLAPPLKQGAVLPLIYPRTWMPHRKSLWQSLSVICLLSYLHYYLISTTRGRTIPLHITQRLWGALQPYQTFPVFGLKMNFPIN